MKREIDLKSAVQIDQSRLRERNKNSFEEAERQGLMLAAKVRIIALLPIIIWVAYDDPSSGISYYYDLLQVGTFAILGALQWL